jgi:hypothetical protein
MTAFAGEVLPAGAWTPAEAAAHVIESYECSVLAVIETGRRLLEAKERLPHGAWLPFVELLPFSERSAQRFMAIASHPELANTTHGSDLPVNWRTLAVLAQLPPGEVTARIESGEITPELVRAKAEEWVRGHQEDDTTGQQRRGTTRRRPLAEQARTASYDFLKAAERLARIAADDRYPQNKEQVRDAIASDLRRAIETLTTAFQQLQLEQTTLEGTLP